MYMCRIWFWLSPRTVFASMPIPLTTNSALATISLTWDRNVSFASKKKPSHRVDSLGAIATSVPAILPGRMIAGKVVVPFCATKWHNSLLSQSRERPIDFKKLAVL
ncbi:hypothetical protein IW261DRAFT_1511400, partial [Armillaria novae-zelandiae]